MNYLLKELSNSQDIDITAVRAGEMYYRYTYRQNISYIVMCKCVLALQYKIGFEDIAIMYTSSDNHNILLGRTVFQRDENYPGIKFFRVNKDITPEYFL